MNATILVVGVAVALLAALVLVFFVLAPPAPRVASDRRRAPGVEHVSALARVAERTTAVVENAVSKQSRRAFGPDELEMAGIKTEPGGFLVMVGSAASVLALFGVLLGLSNGTSLIWAIVFAIMAPVGAKIVVIQRTSKTAGEVRRPDRRHRAARRGWASRRSRTFADRFRSCE